MTWRAVLSTLSVSAVSVLTACTVVGPEYEPPQPVIPEVYRAPIPQVLQEAAGRETWWDILGDPVLNVLIDYGRKQNLELAAAASRAREARAIARGVEGLTGPSLDTSADARGAWQLQKQDGSSADVDREPSVQGALSGVWDLDLFGGQVREREAAWAEAEQAAILRDEADRIAVSELATAYVELRTAERRLALTREILDLQRQTLDLVDQRVESGLAPALDRSRARAAVFGLQADIGPLGAQIRRFRDAIAVLVAQPPGALDEFLGSDTRIPVADGGPAIGVPRDMVRRRPDIRAAELAIAAATAEVGVATAALYPRFSLSGTISVAESSLGSVDAVTTVLGSLAGLIDYQLYDGGARANAVTAAEERVNQAVVTYRQTLLTALRDVEDALSGYAGARDRSVALRAAVQDNREAYRQSQELYRQGLIDFLTVLDSQRQWNDTLQQLALSERDLSLEIISLYTALGGTAAAARTAPPVS